MTECKKKENKFERVLVIFLFETNSTDINQKLRILCAFIITVKSYIPYYRCSPVSNWCLSPLINN